MVLIRLICQSFCQQSAIGINFEREEVTIKLNSNNGNKRNNKRTNGKHFPAN